MSKPIKHDPLWAKAKNVCRINQDDIEMAKQLGLKPRSLMKNNPSPSQRWKVPVKQWIRELYEKRFGPRKPGSSSRLNDRVPRVSAGPRGTHPKAEPKLGPAFRDETDARDDDEDDFEEYLLDCLPSVEFDLALRHNAGDATWQQLRLTRRQKNMCWVASSLAVRLRDVPEVDVITLFGSVAKSLRDPLGQPWDGPDAEAVCHTLNLALWVTSWNEATLCTISLIVAQTLAGLGDVECIAFQDGQLELLLLDADSEQFLGRLRRPGGESPLPSLEISPDFIFSLAPLLEPQAVMLFERTPPHHPDDCPF